MRQHFNSMPARILVQKEIEACGFIQGADGTHDTLDAWFAAERAAILVPFADAGGLYQEHKATTAYLVFKGVIQGAEREGLRYLDPLTSLRSAVTMIVRAEMVAESF